MSKQPPTAPTASEVGPCPTIILIVGRPGTGSLPRTIAPPDHPLWAIQNGRCPTDICRQCHFREHLQGGSEPLPNKHLSEGL